MFYLAEKIKNSNLYASIIAEHMTEYQIELLMVIQMKTAKVLKISLAEQDFLLLITFCTSFLKCNNLDFSFYSLAMYTSLILKPRIYIGA